MQKHQVSTKSDSTVKSMQAVKRKRNEWRITKMVLAIFLSFVISYLPITIIKTTDPNVHRPGKLSERNNNHKKMSKLIKYLNISHYKELLLIKIYLSYQLIF